MNVSLHALRSQIARSLSGIAVGFAKASPKISGEGFSEFAVRRGNLVSVKARLEVTATDPDTDKLLATDRQVTVEVDLTEQIAGKNALQKAALEIAQRLLPKLVREWNAQEK